MDDISGACSIPDERENTEWLLVRKCEWRHYIQDLDAENVPQSLGTELQCPMHTA